LYAVLHGELLQIHPTVPSVQFFETTKGKAIRGLTIGEDGVVYFGAGVDMWVYHPQTPKK
jgi:hypothetical protein